MSTITIFLLITFVGCSGREKLPEANTSSTQLNHADTLRNDRPQIAFDIVDAEGNLLEITVDEVRNLKKTKVIVDVFFIVSQIESKVGAFTLYPADHPGKYVFKVPASGKGGSVRLQLKNASRFDNSFFLRVTTPTIRK